MTDTPEELAREYSISPMSIAVLAKDIRLYGEAQYAAGQEAMREALRLAVRGCLVEDDGSESDLYRVANSIDDVISALPIAKPADKDNGDG